VGGYTCKPWNLREGAYKPANNPGKGLDKNYCRNPDDDVNIWCFTNNPSKSWDYCKPLDQPTLKNTDNTDRGTGPSLWGAGDIQPAGV